MDRVMEVWVNIEMIFMYGLFNLLVRRIFNRSEFGSIPSSIKMAQRMDMLLSNYQNRRSARPRPFCLVQEHAGVSPAPPVARGQPVAEVIRPLLVQPSQTRFESFDSLWGYSKPRREKSVT